MGLAAEMSYLALILISVGNCATLLRHSASDLVLFIMGNYSVFLTCLVRPLA